MNFYSLTNPSLRADFRTCTIQGQAPDGGLYFPERIPAFDTNFLKSLKIHSDEAIAFETMWPFVEGSLSKGELLQILEKLLSFDIPLVQVTDRISSLELYHGPTLAFKDVGAGFMSRCLSVFSKTFDRPVTVLVATSGDTGGAVASGFYDVPGVEVVILYPKGRVSEVQELQLTSLGKNIRALQVDGTFDDCQAMVKRAFADAELSKQLFLTSANSINVARWLPQQIYYLLALKQWNHLEPPVIAVPSGNFGNLAAAVLAAKRGMPVNKFIAACNANDVVPDYFESGVYTARNSKATLSNAMDVGHPSNLPRIEVLYGSLQSMKENMLAISISDQQTQEVINEIDQSHHYLLDPHGAVAFKALSDYLDHHQGQRGIFLETAHPIKFAPVVEPIISRKVDAPEVLAQWMNRPKFYQQIAPDYQQFLEYLG